jgi:hypothetical protein
MSRVVDFGKAVFLNFIICSFLMAAIIDCVIDPIAEIDGKENCEDHKPEDSDLDCQNCFGWFSFCQSLPEDQTVCFPV